jgi:hypothetical protein
MAALLSRSFGPGPVVWIRPWYEVPGVPGPVSLTDGTIRHKLRYGTIRHIDASDTPDVVDTSDTSDVVDASETFGVAFRRRRHLHVGNPP